MFFFEFLMLNWLFDGIFNKIYNYYASGLISTTDFNELLKSVQLCRTFFVVYNTVYLCQVVATVTFMPCNCEQTIMLYRECSITVCGEWWMVNFGDVCRNSAKFNELMIERQNICGICVFTTKNHVKIKTERRIETQTNTIEFFNGCSHENEWNFYVILCRMVWFDLAYFKMANFHLTSDSFMGFLRMFQGHQDAQLICLVICRSSKKKK